MLQLKQYSFCVLHLFFISMTSLWSKTRLKEISHNFASLRVMSTEIYFSRIMSLYMALFFVPYLPHCSGVFSETLMSFPQQYVWSAYKSRYPAYHRISLRDELHLVFIFLIYFCIIFEHDYLRTRKYLNREIFTAYSL